MHVLSLRKSAKYGCLSWINDKIINNLLGGGYFGQILMTPSGRKVRGCNDGTEVFYHHACKIWWKSNDERRRQRTKCDVFHFVSLFVTMLVFDGLSS